MSKADDDAAMDAAIADPAFQANLGAALVEAFAWAIGDPRKHPKLRKLYKPAHEEEVAADVEGR